MKKYWPNNIHNITLQVCKKLNFEIKLIENSFVVHIYALTIMNSS